ncbi:MAG: urease accessory protein UreF [Desulfobacterales bacterium]|nr:urease accessory protein UreF [Desulfobacterales bacterium]
MNRDNSLLRLLHLVSPTLPTGAFSYSQGLEWAVEAGWIDDGPSLGAWLADLAGQSLAFVDIAILGRMYRAIENEQQQELEQWCAMLLACRETAELRREEHTRGRALATLLQGLGVAGARRFGQSLRRSQLAGFALAAVRWDITLRDAALGYAWAWLENQILAGIKIIPLGQTEGQGLLLRLSADIAETVDQGLNIEDAEIGSANPALALACSLHENQYTRLYRS